MKILIYLDLVLKCGIMKFLLERSFVMPKFVVPQVLKKARIAIAQGIKEDHHISAMEELGVTQRMMNLFEDNGIIKLKDLVFHTQTDLLELPNFGEKQLILLFTCLAKYDKLEM